jgi:two-component sensor histidine kinase
LGVSNHLLRKMWPYALATTCVGAAIAVRAGFGWFGATLYFATFYPAMLIAALYGGAVSGALVALAASVYVWWALMPPFYEFGPLNASAFSNFVLFGVAATLIIWVSIRLRKSESDLKIAVGELAHRGKNTFFVVEAIVRQTLSEHRDLADKVAGRIRAVSSTNDLVSSSSAMSVDLRELLLSKLEGIDAVSAIGPQQELPSNVARGLSLIFHELLTNALKYGALSAPGGKVGVKWDRSGDILNVQWRESGGPPVLIASRVGFGTKLMTYVARDLKGEIHFEPKSEGMTARLSLSLK